MRLPVCADATAAIAAMMKRTLLSVQQKFLIPKLIQPLLFNDPEESQERDSGNLHAVAGEHEREAQQLRPLPCCTTHGMRIGSEHRRHLNRRKEQFVAVLNLFDRHDDTSVIVSESRFDMSFSDICADEHEFVRLSHCDLPCNLIKSDQKELIFMTIKVFVSAAVVSAIITLIGNIIAAKIAQRTALKTAQETTNQEIKKLERTWEREDIVSSDDEFAEMAAAVAKFVHHNSYEHRDKAVAKVAAVRSKESGCLGEDLDLLYDAIRMNKQLEADQYLTMAINEKRDIKRETQPNH